MEHAAITHAPLIVILYKDNSMKRPITRPNIVIFNPDQWRGDVLGHRGTPGAITPTLDGLVGSDAVSFANTFCQNPVCTPSRCSFMSGWYPHVRGHRTMQHMLHAEQGEPNVLRILREQGYFVWWGGKNDLLPGQLSTAADADIRHQTTEQECQGWGHTLRPNLHVDQHWRDDAGSDGFYSFFAGQLDCGQDSIYCDSDWAHVLAAIELITTYQGEQPLCIYLPLEYPHPPYAVEDPWYRMIDRALISDPIPPPPAWEGKPAILRELWRLRGMQQWSPKRWRELRATYYGMCARSDHQLGRVVQALRQSGRYDTTALFFLSDHGDFTGDYGLVEKTQNTFEDCLTRVPFMVKPPANLPCTPGVRTQLVELVDFAATVYDVAGIDPGYDHFGKSLLGLMADPLLPHRDTVFCEGGRRQGEVQAMELESGCAADSANLYWPRAILQADDTHPYHRKAVMVRTDRFKYVYRSAEQDELYDLVRDPQELTNRIDDPTYAAIAAQLRERMLDWLVETADVVPRSIDKR
jgi:arylsulfatase A-like enzyme